MRKYPTMRTNPLATRGLLCSALLASLTIGCDPTSFLGNLDPGALNVMYAGCHQVLEGPVCELPDSESGARVLTLHVESRRLPNISFGGLDGNFGPFSHSACSKEICSHTLSGMRFRLKIPEGTAFVVVEAQEPGVAPWQLEVMDHRNRPEVFAQAQQVEQTESRSAAANLLLRHAPMLEDHWKAEALSRVGRYQKRQGAAAEALATLNTSRQLHLVSGNLSMFVRDTTVAVQTLIIDAGMQLDAARKLAAEMRGILPQHYESQHFYHWSSQFAANKARDHREALLHGELGTQLAQSFGNQLFESYLASDYSHTLQKLGRFQEAIQVLTRQTKTIDPSALRCRDAELLNTLGFVQWHQRQSTRGQSDEWASPLPTFEQALAIAEEYCVDGTNQHEQTNSWINLALAYLDLNEPEKASESLSHIDTTQNLKLFHRQWLTQTRGEIALTQQNARVALQAFSQLSQMSPPASYPYLQLRSQLGQARAHALLGDFPSAHNLWQSIQNKLEREGLLVPIHEGRDLFLAHHHLVTGEYVSSLLKTAATERALAVVRAARTRLLRSLTWQNRMESLSETQRTIWQLSLGRYQGLRQELETLLQNEWQLATTELAEHRRKRARLEKDVAQSFDAALAQFGHNHSGPSPQIPRPEAGEIRLSYFHTGAAWVGFVETATGVRSEPLDEISNWESRSELSRMLLAPFAEEIRSANRIHVETWGMIQSVDFHSLPFNQEALIAHAPVVYTLGLSVRPTHARHPTPSALVVSDPLGNLPHARTEGAAVALALENQFGTRLETLTGSSATNSEIRSKITSASFFHYAGHGQFSSNNNTNSSLILANNSHLDVSDILALPRVPEQVILSACETGRADTALPHEELGIAQAFVTAGSHVVVASTRSIEDTLSQFMMTLLYQSYASSGDLVVALQHAQNQAALQFPQSDWASFRIIARN